MRLVIDSHTHSVASGHAYSTIDDLAQGAVRRRLEGFAITDHGPAMPGGTHPYYFGNLKVLPTMLQGVRLFKGIEANIINEKGEVDLEPVLLARLDFVMAGFHEICFESQGLVKNTDILIATLANPFVDAISHPGNPAFPIDIPVVVKAAHHYGKALEINDSSFRVRHGSSERCMEIAHLCVQENTRIVCGSDAHYREDVGRFDEVLNVLVTVPVPESLVLNASNSVFTAFIEERRSARQQAIQ
jgi:putative hydrolase